MRGPRPASRLSILSAAAIFAAGCGSVSSSSSGTRTNRPPTAGSTASSGGIGSATAPPTVPRGVARGHLTVAPLTGNPATTFVLHFTAPASATQIGTTRLGYTVAVTGGRGGCLGPRSVPVAAVQKGATVAIPLRPSALGGRWCTGRHIARVIESQGPSCSPGTMCPQFVRVIGTVAAADFTVAP